MNPLRNLFDRKNSRPTGLSPSELDALIFKARQRHISIQELIDALYGATIFVPMSSEPKLDRNGGLQSWGPATVTKASNNSQFVAAFTSEAQAKDFLALNRQYTHVFQTSTVAIVASLPIDNGVVFNLGSSNGFEWPASGVAEYITHIKASAT
jgi:hypothetical protein